MTRRIVIATIAVLALAGPAAGAPPKIAAPSAIVVEASTGDVAYAKAPDARRAMASTTKLMTALLAIEAGGMSEVVPAARYRAGPSESTIGLAPGERMTQADLVRALLVESANDAAITLAVHVGGSVGSFVRLMNRRAQELGLTNTHYANPIGLDSAANHSSARDLVTLTLALRRHRFFRRTVNEAELTLKSGARPRTLTNRNTLLQDYGWVDGVKTGFTRQAGNVLVASGAKRGVRLVSAVLGEPTEAARNAESVELLEYAFTRYQLKRAVVRGDVIARVPIRYRAGAELPLVASRSVRRVLGRQERFGFELSGVPKQVDGPVRYGQRIGRLVVTARGKPVASVALSSALEVPKASLGRRTQDMLTRPWMLVVLTVLLLVVAVASRRPPRRSDRGRLQAEEAEVA